jgi:hypothetical protein
MTVVQRKWNTAVLYPASAVTLRLIHSCIAEGATAVNDNSVHKRHTVVTELATVIPQRNSNKRA